MHAGVHPRYALDFVERRQEEMRAEVGAWRSFRKRRNRMPVAFKLGRLHVMLWFDGAHGAR